MYCNLFVTACAAMVFLLAPHVSADVISIEGKITSIDVKGRTITIEADGEEQTLDVSRKVKVSSGGKATTLETLKSGQQAKVSYHDELEIVLKIDAANDSDGGEDGFVPLFNGRDLSGWQGRVGDPPKIAAMSSAELKDAQREANQSAKRHWKVDDGVLVYDGKGTSLTTIKHYRNFELRIDWKIEAGGDSGIYLRGCPQVQVWDPAKSSANGVGSGGLYNNKRNPSQPSRKADRPIGEWNTFRIRMIGPVVTVWLNGDLVVDEVPMENHWYRGQPVFPDGPIELQHHGSVLRFRNILIKEIE